MTEAVIETEQRQELEQAMARIRERGLSSRELYRYPDGHLLSLTLGARWVFHENLEDFSQSYYRCEFDRWYIALFGDGIEAYRVMGIAGPEARGNFSCAFDGDEALIAWWLQNVPSPIERSGP